MPGIRGPVWRTDKCVCGLGALPPVALRPFLLTIRRCEIGHSILQPIVIGVTAPTEVEAGDRLYQAVEKWRSILKEPPTEAA
jgi:hypothetical protein